MRVEGMVERRAENVLSMPGEVAADGGRQINIRSVGYSGPSPRTTLTNTPNLQYMIQFDGRAMSKVKIEVGRL
jgi:hypothetical protein